MHWTLPLVAILAAVPPPLHAQPRPGTPPLPVRIASFAGVGESGHDGDGGPAARARLGNPYGIVRGPDGALYVCEIDNHVVRRIAPDGMISTIAGSGQRGYAGDGGP